MPNAINHFTVRSNHFTVRLNHSTVRLNHFAVQNFFLETLEALKNKGLKDLQKSGFSLIDN